MIECFSLYSMRDTLERREAPESLGLMGGTPTTNVVRVPLLRPLVKGFYKDPRRQKPVFDASRIKV